jgi:hypothetical protein
MGGDYHYPHGKFLLVSIGLGAFAGAFMGGPVGAVQLNRTVAGAARGALCGVAAMVMMGLASASYYGPKAGEAHKLTWLIYGVPSGALIGAFVGAIIAQGMSGNSPHPCPGRENGKPADYSREASRRRSGTGDVSDA